MWSRSQRITAKRHRKSSITLQKVSGLRKMCPRNWRNGAALREVRLRQFFLVTLTGGSFQTRKLRNRDHCRPISKMFPNAHGYFGTGTVEYCTPGHIVDPEYTWDGNFFEKEHKTEKLSEHKGHCQKLDTL